MNNKKDSKNPKDPKKTTAATSSKPDLTKKPSEKV